MRKGIESGTKHAKVPEGTVADIGRARESESTPFKPSCLSGDTQNSIQQLFICSSVVAQHFQKQLSPSYSMNADLIVLMAGYTHKLMDLPALAASCIEASKAYRRADMWCGKITVEHHMVKTVTKRAHFLRWWFGVCSSPGLHIELWLALRPLMAMNIEAYDLISSAVLMTRCSHDLFCWGFCMESNYTRNPLGVRELVSQNRSIFAIWVPDDKCYGIITDGPVPSGPFSFTLTAYPRPPDRTLGVECCVGYVPWPPMPDSFTPEGCPSGGLYLDILEDDLLGNTATFQLCMSSGRALQVRNLSLQKEVRVLFTSGSTLTSPTGAYAFYCFSNCNLCTLSLCTEGEFQS